MIARRGASSLGCLFSLLIAVAVVYFGVNIGGVYWRAYQFEDDMQQQMKYMPNRPNEAIIARLRAAADSLDLPEDARKIAIRRTEKAVQLEAYYEQEVDLPLFKRTLHFHPHAEGTP